jgi:hypothetical protein
MRHKESNEKNDSGAIIEEEMFLRCALKSDLRVFV